MLFLFLTTYTNSMNTNWEMLEIDGKNMYIDCNAEDLFGALDMLGGVKLSQLSKDQQHIN